MSKTARKKLALHTQIFIGLTAGLVAGLLVNIFFPNDETVKWIAKEIAYPIGQVFLRLIFMVIVPLIFSALALGVADLGDVKKIGRVGIKTLLFTVVITALGVVVGILLVNLFQPGVGLSQESRNLLMSTLSQNQAVSSILSSASESKSFTQTLLDFIPRNPFVEVTFFLDPNYRGGGLIAMMFFALMFGIAMTLCEPEKMETLTKVLQGINDVVMKIIDVAMRLAPYGVAALIFTATSQLGFQIVAILAKYVFVVLFALAFHQFITYGIIIKLGAKRNPIEFFKGIVEVMLTAFSTSSSNATLPTSMRVSVENLGINRDISNFVLTIGSTANQNGTALYEGITVLFLAQFYGIELSVGQQILVVLLAILAGVGTAGVPGGSLPLVVLVLQQIGVPVEGIGVILGVDRILDMSRTVVNVTGDITLAAWVESAEPIPHSQEPAASLQTPVEVGNEAQ
jgi:DAACS family dicarboxylate/amino acid:cation (Na+ or H+) symporter